jgi:hypothetical protein
MGSVMIVATIAFYLQEGYIKGQRGCNTVKKKHI